MSRPIKYSNADSLFANCRQVNDCLVWPDAVAQTPAIAPTSPLALKFQTSSVARIVFTICRFPPSGRIIRCCDQPYCINPFHHIEANAVRKKRIKSGHPSSLLPQQETTRHLTAPSDEELIAMRPVNPNITMLLANSAAVAGFDGSGILNRRGEFVRMGKPKPTFADPAKPVLVIKRGTAPATPEEKEVIEKDAEDFFSGSFFKALQNTRARTD
jgi:hypothetical protein